MRARARKGAKPAYTHGIDVRQRNATVQRKSIMAEGKVRSAEGESRDQFAEDSGYRAEGGG